ncbi:MAG: GTP cyclohydrolase [Gammaproteobacteria bacterium]|nr:GTP cyclohydrolase [Gammaproteobacteria bacterium]|tara:strand:+ start:96 stop:896 length:801 start_codon:yes stop_codon:yes gene_type:complete
MFTYINPKTRDRLKEQNTFYQIDRNGVLIDNSAQNPLRPEISILGPIPLPLKLQSQEINTKWFACVSDIELNKIENLATKVLELGEKELFSSLASFMTVNNALVIGNPSTWVNPLVRIHSTCMTGDIFGSMRCECGPQMQLAMDRIQADKEGGLLIYMSGHEGRGIGIWAKAAAYLLQDTGEDTYQANQSLGMADDLRDFSNAATILKHFVSNQPFRLLTNNPKKIDDLKQFGINNVSRVKHVVGINNCNRRYLEAKKKHGHKIEF